MKSRVRFLLWAGVVGLALSCSQELVAAAAGTSSGEFLSLPGDAKGAAMGEATSSMASGAVGLWYNPATLSRKDNPSLSLMHTAYLEGLTFDTLAVAIPFGHQHAFGFGAEYLSVGSVASYDNTGAAAPSYSPRDVNVRMGYAKTFHKTSLGLSGSFIQSTIQDSASTVAGSFGVHQGIGPFALAMVGENFGGKLKFREKAEPLPQRWRTGLSCQLIPGGFLSADVVQPRSGNGWVAVGSEYAFEIRDAFGLAFRAGYNTQAASELSGLKGVAGGVGVSWAGAQLNYAWVPFGDLGQTHRISLDYEFHASSLYPGGEEMLSSQSALFNNPIVRRPKAVYKARITADQLPLFPWKKTKTGKRTSQDKIMSLLARDALCTPDGPHAVITKTRGSVSVLMSHRDIKQWMKAKPGKFLFQGDMVQTRSNAYAHLIFSNGAQAEIKSNTLVKIEESPAICERCSLSLDHGSLATVTAPGKQLDIKTEVGEAHLDGVQGQLDLEDKKLVLDIVSGSATFTSNGVTTPLSARTTFTISEEKKEKTRPLTTMKEDAISTSITPPEEKLIPGRWDTAFADKFGHDLKELNAIPGVSVAEYMRESSLRGELKLAVSDLNKKMGELGAQETDFQRDILNFQQMRLNLKKSMAVEMGEQKRQLKAQMKEVKSALLKSQYSMRDIQKDLKVVMVELRKNLERLAAVPIVRMLNITAQESTIPFQQGKAVVPVEAQMTLDAIGQSINKMKPRRVVVEGHSDTTGSPVANTRLSKSRAEAVAHYLRTKTMDPDLLYEIKGMGSKYPLEEGDSPDALARNRRVEIWFELRGL